MTQNIITRPELRQLNDQLLKAKADKDWKEYDRISTLVQEAAVGIFKAYGISQLALPKKDTPNLTRYVRVSSEEDLDSPDQPGGACLLDCYDSKQPEKKIKGGWIGVIFPPIEVSYMLRVIGELQEMGIPTLEWGKLHEIPSAATTKSTKAKCRVGKS